MGAYAKCLTNEITKDGRNFNIKISEKNPWKKESDSKIVKKIKPKDKQHRNRSKNPKD